MIAGVFAAAVWLWPQVGPAAGMLPVVVLHYFLFCNVLRFRPWREGVWAVVLIWDAGVFASLGTTHWLPITAAILPTTGILAFGEVTSADYRGVGAGSGNGRVR